VNGLLLAKESALTRPKDWDIIGLAAGINVPRCRSHTAVTRRTQRAGPFRGWAAPLRGRCSACSVVLLRFRPQAGTRSGQPWRATTVGSPHVPTLSGAAGMEPGCRERRMMVRAPTEPGARSQKREAT
jgi:hypothetical protein